MAPNGKYAQGLRGFPTPNNIPADGGYIVFRIPSDNEWAGLILGAAQLLAQEYNWYQWGDMTPEEASQAFQVIVNQAPYDTCGCTLPNGSRVIRIGADGHFEELGEDGLWGPPSGDYAIPPVPARTGGTPEDQQCLAAANAANVLEQLYENLADSWAEGLTTAEAATNWILALAALIAAPFGLIGEAIVAIAALVFNVLYETLEFIGADLWDATFTEALKCILYNCSNNLDGVVTFDFACVNDALAAQTNPFDLSASQLRLFGQIQYIFSFIGVDGLNLAGATTAITSADCDECGPEECTREIHFDDPLLYTFITRIPGITATLDTSFGHPLPSAQAGTGLDVTIPAFSCDVRTDLGSPQNVTNTIFEYYYNRSDGEGIYLYVQYFDNAGAPITINSVSLPMAAAPYDEWHTFEDTIGCAGARYVQFGFGGENIGLVAEGWLDTVCINY